MRSGRRHGLIVLVRHSDKDAANMVIIRRERGAAAGEDYFCRFAGGAQFVCGHDLAAVFGDGLDRARLKINLPGERCGVAQWFGTEGLAVEKQLTCSQLPKTSTFSRWGAVFSGVQLTHWPEHLRGTSGPAGSAPGSVTRGAAAAVRRVMITTGFSLHQLSRSAAGGLAWPARSRSPEAPVVAGQTRDSPDNQCRSREIARNRRRCCAHRARRRDRKWFSVPMIFAGGFVVMGLEQFVVAIIGADDIQQVGRPSSKSWLVLGRNRAWVTAREGSFSWKGLDQAGKDSQESCALGVSWIFIARAVKV